MKLRKSTAFTFADLVFFLFELEEDVGVDFFFEERGEGVLGEGDVDALEEGGHGERGFLHLVEADADVLLGYLLQRSVCDQEYLVRRRKISNLQVENSL